MSGRCTIGVDLGGTKLLAGVVDEDLRVVARLHRRIGGMTRPELYAALVDAVAEVTAEAGDRALLPRIGIGIPSLIDTARGLSVSCVHLPLDGVPFAADLEGLLGRPVVVDNDANCHVLAEWKAGAAAGCSDVVLLTLGTGIGGGLILGGRIQRGAQGAGAELGHVVVDLDGPSCFGDCPNRGCLESLCSGTALERDAELGLASFPASVLADAPGPLSGEAIVGAARVGDEFACALLSALGRALGAGLASFVNAFNPELIVVGGGLMAAGELILDPARDEMLARALAPSRDLVRIVPAALGSDAGFIGAALLARGEDT